MKKLSTSKIVIAVVFIVIVPLGTFTYMQLRTKPTQSSPATAEECNIHDESKTLCADGYINLTEADAKAKAKNEGQLLRIFNRDIKNGTVGHDDLHPYRLNITISGGKVVKAEFG